MKHVLVVGKGNSCLLHFEGNDLLAWCAGYRLHTKFLHSRNAYYVARCSTICNNAHTMVLIKPVNIRGLTHLHEVGTGWFRQTDTQSHQ